MGWNVTVTSIDENQSVKVKDFSRTSVFWTSFCFWFRDRLNFDQYKSNYLCRSYLFASWCMIFIYINFDTIKNGAMYWFFEWLFYQYEVEIPWDYNQDDDPQEKFESFLLDGIYQCVNVLQNLLK